MDNVDKTCRYDKASFSFGEDLKISIAYISCNATNQSCHLTERSALMAGKYLLPCHE